MAALYQPWPYHDDANLYNYRVQPEQQDDYHPTSTSVLSPSQDNTSTSSPTLHTTTAMRDVSHDYDMSYNQVSCFSIYHIKTGILIGEQRNPTSPERSMPEDLTVQPTDYQVYSPTRSDTSSMEYSDEPTTTRTYPPISSTPPWRQYWNWRPVNVDNESVPHGPITSTNRCVKQGANIEFTNAYIAQAQAVPPPILAQQLPPIAQVLETNGTSHAREILTDDATEINNQTTDAPTATVKPTPLVSEWTRCAYLCCPNPTAWVRL